MKVLVTGLNGQLGSALHKISTNYNYEWIFTDRRSFDISDLDNIDNFLDKFKPHLIINCAANTHVDRAEYDFELVDIVNHKAIGLIAKWCNNQNCKLIHISTDYVYDGISLIPYVETDKANPLNNYGKSKLLGDIACQKNNPSSIIIRTSWLFSNFGINFLTKMINLMQNNNEIDVINDQYGSPTYALDLANNIMILIKKNKWQPGIYNYTNYGKVSWYNFVNEIKSICGFHTIINPVSSENYFQKAKRPKYSVLDNSKFMNTFNIKQINYLDSLKKCIKILKNES